MKKYILLLLVPVALSLGACTKNFDTVYSDPEALKNTAAGYFLNEILYDGANAGMRQALFTNNELTQVTVYSSDTRETQRYLIRTTEYDYSWENYYAILKNVKDMRLAAQRDKYVNCEAISLVLWAWLFENLVDTYGDIPYYQALKGYPEYQLRNKFDRQDEIYQDLVNKLDTANNMFNTAAKMEIGSDFMYNAQDSTTGTTTWKKLGNSLRLRLLMRISAKSAEARAQINLILSNPGKYPVFTAATESAAVRYTNTGTFLNPYFNARNVDWNGNRAMGKFFIDTLNAWNDTRLAKWCAPTSGQYVGMPSGFTRAETDSITDIPTSVLLLDLKSSSLTGQIMQYAEVEFIRAEAILRGYTSGDAKTAYENGIKGSFSYWGLSTPSDYLSRAGVAYNGTIPQVMLQKYYALFFNDMQQWAEIRRTGYPVLPRGNATKDKEYPRRIPYPLLVQSTNAENYQQAVINMGGDALTTKLWWQP
ncbi:Starch-binding associating with outer membrane [Filimonas lacunae]|uniref:Starch-binding associating with outer membrane n=1 Tax=Filimonas lacunae TaxID=477680 RepID=A0A173MCZ7_9BACT|nr:SusD/RagB family nutrient-binding outer membrane lipoprotein [Filimonas lacunae]BAV05452.1 hypothetical protein FLA_1459 [Filimonas lacunae]SIT21054.1 Starch-binding associating with outer membrane [Filimonas lacunae]